jgi:hypothetical protein
VKNSEESTSRWEQGRTRSARSSKNSDGDYLQENCRETNSLNGFYSVVVELNYCNDLKRKKNGGQEEKKEGKKRRKGDDFFFKVLEVCQKLGSQPEFLVTGKFPSICLSILTNAVKTAGLDVRT